MITEEIRSYEVSIWTLLDEFLTVLKWSDAEQKGRIENPKMIINIDGTLNFDFSIPMYYRYNGKLIDNPGWYNTLNGNLIEGMRKIKVIFNKKTADEAVYEFLIVNTEESHEKDMSVCNVKCEGLAFHELGKRGYKISLSQENFELKYKEWAESDGSEDEPIESLDYWCNDKDTCNIPKRPINENEIDPNTWYYVVTMNHKSFKEGSNQRANNKVYETPYATSWSTNLTPGNFEYYLEKARSVSIDKSNLYNITQTIAEAFEIHCTYKYTYDDNYHITSRTIVFYNHFFQEEEGAMSFTYPYSSSKITRTNESKDLITKLFVLTADNENTVSGYNTIMNAASNASKEDYILNFDYMHERKIITDELYDTIKPYEKKMRDYNNELIMLQLNLSTYEILKPEIEAKTQVYKKSLELDLENLDLAQKLRNTLDLSSGAADGYITVDNNNPDLRLISLEIDTGKYYINLTTTNKGIVLDSIRIYRTYNSTTHVLSNEITSGFSYSKDTFERLDRIYGIEPTESSNKVYLTYNYDPHLYYDAVIKIWNSKLGSDIGNYEKELRELGPESITDEDFDLSAVYTYYANTLSLTHRDFSDATAAEKTSVMTAAYNAGLNKKILDTKEDIQDLIEDKTADIKEFERIMGPALREGYWLPEDYLDYGNHLNDTKALSVSNDITADSGESFIVGWDDELFDDEEKNYYEEGVELTKIYYPCIDLSYKPNGTNTLYDMIKSNIGNYSFIFNNNYLNEAEIGENDARYTSIFAIDSKALLLFGKKNGVIYPLLVLVGAKSMTADEITFMKRNTVTENNTTTKGGNPRLGVVHWNENGVYNIVLNNPTPINVAAAFVDGSEYTTVYPRIKFSSLNLRANSSDFYIYYNNTDIEVARDYIILTRNTLRDGNYYPEYYLTVFPSSIYKAQTLNGNFEVHYVIFNADNLIYLDALEVSKENAYPKVDYTVEPTILNRNLSRTLYSKLATLVMINDTLLKFENVFGYISLVELDLDNVTNDRVEVKNYKTKFEDLFSTIVALTEDMKRDGIAVHAAAEGNVALSPEALIKSLTSSEMAIQAFLDSYFDSSEVVKERLASLFTEASEILGDSNKSLNLVRALTIENAEILSGFASNISSELTTKITKSATKPTNYKPGDIWIDNEGNRYVATSYSSEGLAGGTSGFVRTYDGTLASMTGAALDINADEGKIKLTAANNLYLASNLVDIVGNDVVNIGGATVNIVSLTKDGTAYSAGGINLIAGAYLSNGNYGNTSRVLISPTLVEMGAATLRFKAASSIDMIASTGTGANTSTITLNPNTGIWIGSGKSVSLFSGSNTSGSNVQLTPTHIIMGVSSGANTSAFELLKDFLVMAVGTTSSDFSSSNVTVNASGSLTGMKLTKESFGLAIGSGTSRTVILANTDGITLGSGNTPITTGSYVKISSTNGIELGSLADLYINTDNFKLLTHSRASSAYPNNEYIDGNTILALGAGFNTNNITGRESIADLRTMAERSTNPVDIRLVVNQNGAYLKGDIFADNGYFHGNVHATNFILDGATAISDFNTAVENTAIISGIYTDMGNTKSTVLVYYLTTESVATNVPSPLTVVDSTTSLNTWSYSYPLYPVDSSTSYYYYYSVLTTTNTGIVTYSDPQHDYGVTSAAQAASIAKITRDAFNTNGLLSNYPWGGITWPVALTSTSNLLIGANGDTMNGGIWIAKSATYSDGAAVIINKDGIAMAGSTISLNADSTINIASGATININSPNLTIKSNPNSGENYFYVGNNNDQYIRYTLAGNLEIAGSGSFSGTITASGGTIGGMHIHTERGGWIGNLLNDPEASDIRWWSLYGMGALKNVGTEAGIPDYTYPVFWAGASPYTLGPCAAPFRVFENGMLFATSGQIGGWTLSSTALTNNTSGIEKVFMGKQTDNTIDWVMYIGADYPEGWWNSTNSTWVGDRPTYWAPFRVNTRGELYTETLCLGNGPANVSADTCCGHDGWADYIGKLWLFVKYDEDSNGVGDYRWECIDSTALWKAVTTSSSNSGYTPKKNPAPALVSGAGCFIAGTPIKLPNGKTIPIEELRIGDLVLSYNIETKKFEISEVQLLEMLKHKIAYKLHLSDNTIISVTSSHPLLTTQGWKALDPQKAKTEHGVECTMLLELDLLVSIDNKKIYIKEIEYRNIIMDATVYNLGILPNNTFIVNNIVVHNRFVEYWTTKDAMHPN